MNVKLDTSTPPKESADKQKTKPFSENIANTKSVEKANSLSNNIMQSLKPTNNPPQDQPSTWTTSKSQNQQILRNKISTDKKFTNLTLLPKKQKSKEKNLQQKTTLRESPVHNDEHQRHSRRPTYHGTIRSTVRMSTGPVTRVAWHPPQNHRGKNVWDNITKPPMMYFEQDGGEDDIVDEPIVVTVLNSSGDQVTQLVSTSKQNKNNNFGITKSSKKLKSSNKLNKRTSKTKNDKNNMKNRKQNKKNQSNKHTNTDSNQNQQLEAPWNSYQWANKHSFEKRKEYEKYILNRRHMRMRKRRKNKKRSEENADGTQIIKKRRRSSRNNCIPADRVYKDPLELLNYYRCQWDRFYEKIPGLNTHSKVRQIIHDKMAELPRTATTRKRLEKIIY